MQKKLQKKTHSPKHTKRPPMEPPNRPRSQPPGEQSLASTRSVEEPCRRRRKRRFPGDFPFASLIFGGLQKKQGGNGNPSLKCLVKKPEYKQSSQNLYTVDVPSCNAMLSIRFYSFLHPIVPSLLNPTRSMRLAHLNSSKSNHPCR